MAQPAAANNVLSKLDGQKPSAFYWQLTILATLGGFLFGYDTSNIGSASTSCPTTCTGWPRDTWCRGRRWVRPPEPSSPARRPTASAATVKTTRIKVSVSNFESYQSGTHRPAADSPWRPVQGAGPPPARQNAGA